MIRRLGNRAVTARAASTLAAVLAVIATPAHAQRDPRSGAPLPPSEKRQVPSPITDRFYIRGTFFDPALRTGLRVDPSAGSPEQTGGVMGTPVSAERDLGLAGRTPMPQFEMMFRLLKRSKLRMNYFESRRTGDQSLTRPILFGDIQFEPGDVVSSSLDFRVFTLTYTYSIIRTERLEIGAGAAVHLLEADAMGAVNARQVSQQISGSGAFPTIPLDGALRISRRFALTARGQYMRAAINGFGGSLGDYHADLQYRWTPNFALGAGYSVMKMSLTLNDSTYTGRFNLNVAGPEAFFRVSF